MQERPILKTQRLILRPFVDSDGPRVQQLANDHDIASTMLNLPHPYEDGVAEKWINTHQENFDNGKGMPFAIVIHEKNELIGSISLTVNPQHEKAELGYWIAKPYWNCGYCTEAARAVLAYGFDILKLNRICAHHFGRNPASGRVMQKIGMHHEGSLRQDIKKWEKFEDIEIYGILRNDPR